MLNPNIQKQNSAFIFVSSEVAVLSQFSPKISVRMPLIGEMGWDDFINICWYFTELHFSNTAVWQNHIQEMGISTTAGFNMLMLWNTRRIASIWQRLTGS